MTQAWRWQEVEIPVTQSRFPKFSEWVNKFRVIWERRVWRQYFTDDKKKFIVENEKDIPMDKVSKWKYWLSFNYFRAFPVYDYQTESVGILTMSQKTIIKFFHTLLQDADFKNPSEYDINITKTIKKVWWQEKTEYTFTPWKHKKLSKEAEKISSLTGVDMDAYYDCKPVEEIFTDIPQDESKF